MVLGGFVVLGVIVESRIIMLLVVYYGVERVLIWWVVIVELEVIGALCG